MKRILNRKSVTLLSSTTLLVWAGALLAQSGGGYDLTWNTYDGGGFMFSTGGSYSLGGTIGQHDAGPATGPLTGGTYSLVGGFWPATVCVCVSDLNYDKKRNGADVQGFAQCFMGGGTNCGCADLNHDGLVDLVDTGLFVTGLLATTPCP